MEREPRGRRNCRSAAVGLLGILGLSLVLLGGCVRATTARAGGSAGAGRAGGLEAARLIRLPGERTGPGRGELRIQVVLPPGHVPNLEAPSRIEVRSISGNAVTFPGRRRFEGVGPRFPMSFPADFHTGAGEVGVDLSIVYCREGNQGLCRIEHAHLGVPVTVAPAAGGGASLVPARSADPAPAVPLLSVTYEVRSTVDRP